MGDDREKSSDARDRAGGVDSEEGDESLRQRVEEGLARILPEVVKKTFEAGLETLSLTDKGRLRSFVSDIRIPRDVAKYFLAQVDDTKNALLRVFAREVREFLENTDLADDMRKVLTSISLEVSTRVRFVPNDSSVGIKPEVDSTVRTVETRSSKQGKSKKKKSAG